jgi:hypothetical protein
MSAIGSASADIAMAAAVTADPISNQRPVTLLAFFIATL